MATIPASDLNAMIAKERAEEHNGPLQLVHVINECLEIIFQYLNLVDMYNMAESDERFIPALQSAFSQRFENKRIVWKFLPAKNRKNFIEIPKKLSAATFFKHFGSKILKLGIVGMNGRDAENGEESMLRHCANSIIDLELQKCGLGRHAIDQPFVKVKQLLIEECCLGPNFSQWFPNVANLTLNHTHFVQYNSFEVHFPELTALKIDELEATMMPSSTISKMLQRNPQLMHLKLYCDYNADVIKSASECLSDLEVLKLDLSEDQFEHSFDDQNFLFVNVKQLTLSYGDNFITNIPLTFRKLEKLRLYKWDGVNDRVLNFINENQSIKELQFADTDEIYNDLVMVIQSLPNLMALTIDASTFTSDELVQLLFDCAKWKITQLRIRFGEHSQSQEFRSKAARKNNIKWTVKAVRYSYYPVFGLHFNKV
ncbi:uncharacterized protein LOC116349690 [Contarinia nasturtii]|uniref:uncharacterized protein LOC116349690 n=1 Tax=Contarinia nasturtii TaxID=265458 RepID=UPI0012D48FCA|nr:uncharacterized protein LOC116349690 [Contarinia nasturtii]